MLREVKGLRDQKRTRKKILNRTGVCQIQMLLDFFICWLNDLARIPKVENSLKKRKVGYLTMLQRSESCFRRFDYGNFDAIERSKRTWHMDNPRSWSTIFLVMRIVTPAIAQVLELVLWALTYRIHNLQGIFVAPTNTNLRSQWSKKVTNWKRVNMVRGQGKTIEQLKELFLGQWEKQGRIVLGSRFQCAIRLSMEAIEVTWWPDECAHLEYCYQQIEMALEDVTHAILHFISALPRHRCCFAVKCKKISCYK